MKYFSISKFNGERKEVSYERAKEIISADYVERVCTYDDLLSQPGAIPCRFYNVEIEED